MWHELVRMPGTGDQAVPTLTGPEAPGREGDGFRHHCSILELGQLHVGVSPPQYRVAVLKQALSTGGTPLLLLRNYLDALFSLGGVSHFVYF